jgi:6-phosphogluconate dehydrogenase
MDSTHPLDIGIVGLGVMGENLALNLERNGFAVGGFDLEEHKRESFARRTVGKQARSARSLAELVAGLQAPRKLLVMVPAGAAVDAVLAELRRLLSAGDVVIDGGNTRFTDTQRRIAELGTPASCTSAPASAAAKRARCAARRSCPAAMRVPGP